VPPRRGQSCFVDDVREICAHHSRRAPSKEQEIDGASQFYLSAVDFENLMTTMNIGPVDENLSIEATCPHERGIEDLRSVRRRHDDDTFAWVEPVHFHEQLVERLLSLVVSRHCAESAA